MKYKYEVGDTVYIRDDLKLGENYGGRITTTHMLRHCGKKAVITRHIYGCGFLTDIDKKGYVWTSEMFMQPAINLYCGGGRKVIAQKGDKEGVARCHPDDKFDLMTGAKLALERLDITTDRKTENSIELRDICDFGFAFGLGFFSAGLAVLGIVTGFRLIWDNLIK